MRYHLLFLFGFLITLSRPSAALSSTIDYPSLQFEIRTLMSGVASIHPDDSATIQSELDLLMSYDWENFSVDQYEHSLLRIAQIQMYIETRQELWTLQKESTFDKAATPAATRTIKCAEKAFLTTHKNIKTDQFCKGVSAVMMIDKKAKKESVFRRGIKRLFGDEFFDLPTIAKIDKVIKFHNYTKLSDKDPLAIVQYFGDAGAERLAKDAQEKKAESEMWDEFNRRDREAFRREWAERIRDRRFIDRESYRLSEHENFRHTA